MKVNFLHAFTLCSAIAAVSIAAPVKAETAKNAIGPSVIFGGGNSAFGIDSKFGVSENFSARPFVYFPSGGTIFGSGLTYDFDLQSRNSQLQITPYAGGFVAFANANNGGGNTTTVGLVGGADFDVSEQVQLRAGILVPISSNNSNTLVSIGAGFRF